METLELWWKKNPSEVVPFCRFKHWSYHPILSFKQRLELLHDAHHTPSYFHINLLQEYLALFPNLVWPNPEDERINVPGTISPTNWSYRTRPFLEEIVSHEGLQEAISKILN
jgi:4-alpha-glucanotransferase